MASHSATTGGGGTSGTGNRTASVTPANGDLIVVPVFAANNSQTSPTVTDNQAGGTYYRLPGSAQCTLGGQTYTLTVHVREEHVRSGGTSHTITATTGANDAAEIGMVRIIPGSTDGLRAGAAAVRSFGFNNGASGAAPSATHNLTPLTGNLCMFFAGSGDTTTTEPSGYTERLEAGQSTPTTRLEIATIDSGNTTATIAAAATASTDWTCCVLEIDTSRQTFSGVYPSTASEMATAVGYGTWTAGYKLDEASGNFAAQFGSAALVPSGSLTRQLDGAISAAHAVGDAGGTFQCASGSTYEPDSGDDQIMVWLIKPGTFSQPYFGQYNGVQFFSSTSGGVFSMTFRVQDGGGGHTSDVTPPFKFVTNAEWMLILTVVERGVNKAAAAVVTSGGTVQSGEVSIASHGSNLGDGATGWGLIGGDSYTTIDQAYVGVGSGIASGMVANIRTAAQNLYEYLSTLQSISGDAAITLDAATCSSAGTVATHGTAAITLDAATCSSAGTVTTHGAAAITLDTVTASSAGTVTTHADAAITLADAAVSSAGTVTTHGAAAITLADLTGSETGTVLVKGEAAITLADASASATGTVTTHADAAITLAAVTVAATAAVVVAASAPITLGDVTSSAAGTVTTHGAAAITLGDALLSSDVDVVIKVDAAPTLEDLSVAATGIAPASGTADLTLADLTGSETGVVLVKGEAPITLDDASASGDGVVITHGAGLETLGELTTSATGAVTVAGGADLVLDGLTLDAQVGQIAIGALQLGELTTSATAGVGIVGDLTRTLAALSLQGEAIVPATGTFAGTLDGLTFESAGMVINRGSASATLDELVMSSAGINTATGRLFRTLDDLGTDLAASAPAKGDAAIQLGAVQLSSQVTHTVHAAVAIVLAGIGLSALGEVRTGVLTAAITLADLGTTIRGVVRSDEDESTSVDVSVRRTLLSMRVSTDDAIDVSPRPDSPSSSAVIVRRR